LSLLMLFALAGSAAAADQRIQYTEEMVGNGHPTKTDTLNRHANVEHNTDGTHKMTSGAAGDMFYHDGTKLTRLGKGTAGQILTQGGSNAPAWGNAVLPRSYLAGLGLSNAADTEHDITIAVGTCRDSSNAYDLTLASAMTKQIDAAWAAGTNAGGLFSGAVGATTWYHVFVIRKDSDGSIDAGFDTSVTAANKPAGYTAYRRIGSVLTDGSSNILNFYQYGDIFLWKASIRDIAVTNPGTSAVTRTLSVPTGVIVEAIINVATGADAADSLVRISCLSINDEAPSTSVTPLADFGAYYNAGGANISTYGQIRVLTNTSAQVRSRNLTSGANTSLYIVTLGWIDRKGRDD